MEPVTVVCDRCKQEIEGLEDKAKTPLGFATAGFYRAKHGWDVYMNDGESVVCDDCMFADPRYQAEYGKPFPKVNNTP